MIFGDDDLDPKDPNNAQNDTTEGDGVSEPGADDGDEGDGDEDDGSADSGEDDAADEDEGQGPEVNSAPRGNRQFGELRKQNRELKERLENIEREAQQFRTRPTGPSPQEIMAEQERVALMPVNEQVTYHVNKVREELGREVSNVRYQTADAADRSAFESFCAKNPAIADIRDDVETELAKLRRNGTNLSREALGKYLLGDRILSRASRAKGKQQRKADDGRARQKAAPGNSRSDLKGSTVRSGGDAEQRRKRLEGVSI